MAAVLTVLAKLVYRRSSEEVLGMTLATRDPSYLRSIAAPQQDLDDVLCIGRTTSCSCHELEAADLVERRRDPIDAGATLSVCADGRRPSGGRRRRRRRSRTRSSRL